MRPCRLLFEGCVEHQQPHMRTLAVLVLDTAMNFFQLLLRSNLKTLDVWRWVHYFALAFNAKQVDPRFVPGRALSLAWGL